MFWSEVEDQAGGDAGRVLCGAVKVREEVIDLDRAEPNVWDEFEIDAAADHRGEGVHGIGFGDEYRSTIV